MRTVAPVTMQSENSQPPPDVLTKPANAEPPRTAHDENTALVGLPAKPASPDWADATVQRVKRFVPMSPPILHLCWTSQKPESAPSAVAVQFMKFASREPTDAAKPPRATLTTEPVGLREATAVQFVKSSEPPVQPTKPPA